MLMGKPPMYKTVDEIEKNRKYFEYCKGYPLTDSKGKQMFNKLVSRFVDVHPPTVTGLALALGFYKQTGSFKLSSKNQSLLTRLRARKPE